MYFVNAQRLRHCLRAAGVIAREHHGLNAQGVQPRNRLLRGGLDGVAKSKQAQHAHGADLRLHQPRNAVTLRLQSVGARL